VSPLGISLLIIDGRTVPANGSLSADVCIIGAGAAGITLALALESTNANILVLESGGLTPEPGSQDLARGRSVGQQYVPLESARLRCLGGSTMHWGGWCRPLEPIDFEARDWVPHSGWPIDRTHLDPYYPRAQEICQLGEFDYDPSSWELPEHSLLQLPPDRIRSRLIQFSPPTRFGVRYRDALDRSRTIRICLHSNLTQLVTQENGKTLTGVRVATLEGNRFAVVAKRYVLATGGIENARMLLASNETVRNGLGNDRDLVGRFFADHIQLDTAGLLPQDPHLNLSLYQPDSRQIPRRLRRAGGRAANVMAYLTLDPKLQRARQTVNYSAKLLETDQTAYFSADAQVDETERSTWEQVTHSLRTLWENLAEELEARLHSGGAKIYKIVTTQEQAPNPSSRVRLGQERDPLGVPRTLLEWRLSELDRHSIRVATDELVRGFGAAGIGKLHTPLDLRSWPANIPISWHHCGTTRMSDDPAKGVVDADLRVHGMDNLYVAGSSVFTTSGNGNPTLTIIALTLRLADHLRGTLR
jgi:choline dehydrogenase-like flavoprotein